MCSKQAINSPTMSGTPQPSEDIPDSIEQRSEDEGHNKEDDPYHESNFTIHEAFFDWLNGQLKLISAPSPPATTRAEHNKHYRSIFSNIRDRLAANKQLVASLFTPPRPSVDLNFPSWPVKGDYCCPCDWKMPQHPDLSLTSQASNGVTGDMLLNGISEILYGEEDYLGREDERPVVEQIDYMRTNREGREGEHALMGELWVCTRGLERPEFEVVYSSSDEEVEDDGEDEGESVHGSGNEQ